VVFDLIQRHARYTNSRQAAAILESWPAAQAQFVRVMSRDYKRVLQSQAAAEFELAPVRARPERG
jgi:glutamate synthase domain-containing protein 3